MKSQILTLVTVLALGASAAWGGDADWQPGGAIVVNAKTISGASYLQQQRHLIFPVLAIATGAGLQATVDTTARTVTVGGKTVATQSMVVVNGVAYLGWRDLSRVIPGLEYGVERGRAVFATGGRREMPSATAVSAAAPAVLLVNAGSPGLPIAAVQTYTVSGKYTVVDFYSEFCPPCKRLAPFLEKLAGKNKEVVVRKFDINRKEVQDGIDFESPLAQQMKLTSVPHLQLYGPDGKLMADGLNPSFQYVYKWCLEAGMTEAEFRQAGLIR